MKWLREPLVHFLLIGGLLFGIFQIWGGPAIAPAGQYHIVVTPGIIENLKVSFQRASQTTPTDRQLDALINDYVREEIFDREARAQNLDQDDPIVRRELSTRMEYFLEDNAATTPPTDAQLTAYMQAHPALFRQPDGSLPPLAEVRATALAAWEAAQRKQTIDAAYAKMLPRYTVEIQKTPPATTTAPAATPTLGNTTAR